MVPNNSIVCVLMCTHAWSIDSAQLQRQMATSTFVDDGMPAPHMHDALFATIKRLFRVWKAEFPESRRIQCHEHGGCTARGAQDACARPPSSSDQAFDRLPSMLRAIMAVGLDLPDRKGSSAEWSDLLHYAGMAHDFERQSQLSAAMLEIYAQPDACSDVMLRRVQELGRPLFSLLSKNPELAADSYSHMWRKYPSFYGHFVPLNVQRNFEQQTHCKQQYRWVCGKDEDGSKVACQIQVLSPRISISQTAMHDICFRVFAMASLQDRTAWHCRDLDLTWLPSTCHKLVQSECTGRQSKCQSCTSKQTWNPFQINTGATYRRTCNTLTIWRSEEAGKTFLHELMHALSFDFEDPKGVSEWAKQHFALADDTVVLFFEAYVETWATFLNVYVIAAQRGLDEKEVRLMMGRERQFVLWQVAKILFYSGFHSFGSFFGVDKGRQLASSSARPFHQSTSVLSYFVIRSAHLWDMAWFTRLFTHPRIVNNKHRPTFATWLSHLLRVFESSAYQSAIDARIDFFISAGVDEKSDDLLRSTMRMTLHET